MKKRSAVKLVSALLCLVMLFSAFPLGAVAVEKASRERFVSRLNFALADEAVVRAIIIYNGDSALDTVSKGKAASVTTASKTVAVKQKALTEEISARGADIAFSYSTLLNGVAVDASYKQLKEIEKMQGVKSVYLANTYSAPVVSESAKTASVTELYGSLPTKGNGAVIAVLDTGFRLTHEVFSTYRVSETLNKAKMEAIRDGAKGLNGKGVYYNAKIPFCYDYNGNDTDVGSYMSHGTAVAGIAAGNSGSYEGIAPYAQLLAMKIFDDTNGQTDSSVYFAALEDAYLLGADVVNLSLGAQNGFAYDYELETEVFGNIYEKLKNAGVFVFGAVGNEYSQGYGAYAYNYASRDTGINAVTADYADYGVASSPASYRDVIAVGSFNNATKYYAYTVTVDEKSFEYTDNAECLADSFWPRFYGQTHDFAVVPGVGDSADYSGVDVNGKIAVVMRGDISYQAQVDNAAANGATALIVINSDDNKLRMDIVNYAVPAVSVANRYKTVFLNSQTKRITVDKEEKLVESLTAMKASDFSSWGCTPELTLKPQICGIGGNVLCPGSGADYSYASMSGTSMATPVVAGYFAAVKAYYKSVKVAPFSSFTNKQMYDFVYSVMLSSAKYNNMLSPRKQGAGIANTLHLSPVYFSQPIINLGDDKGKTGVYSFTVTALSVKEGTVLTLERADIMADYLTEHEGEKYNTLTSIKLDAAVTTDKESYVLSQTPTEITVTVTLSTEAREYLKAFPNGGFVEGYVKFDVVNEDNDPHLTLMGFYGDWNSAPALERYDWADVADADMFLNTTIDENTGLTYAESGYSYYDILEMNVGYTEGYTVDADGATVGVIGDNLYGWVKYDEKRMAFSTAAATGEHLAEGFLIFPALLRNVRHIIMTVSNAATGEVYYVDDTEYAMKNYYDATNQVFQPGTMFMWDGTYLGEADRVEYVDNNTEVKVTFQTQLAYEGAPLITAVEYTMYVDYEAPKVSYEWNQAKKELTVRAVDNQYVSNVFVHNGSNREVYIDAVIENSEKGKEYVAVYDLSAIDFGDAKALTLEVQDYATNYTTVEVQLGYDKGDVNMDGEVDNIDAAWILRYDAGIIELAHDALPLGDVNGDGEANNLDAALILRYESGVIDSL